MRLSAAERVLVHLHGQWNAKSPTREMTQAGICDGARLLRSHVPRTLRSLLTEGLVEAREGRLPGRTRRMTIYALTPAGLAHAREILARSDALTARLDGRTTTLGEARKALGLTPLEALAALQEDDTLRPPAPPSDDRGMLQREEDLGFLRRWRSGGAPVAVVYGSRGMGKTALGRAFSRTVGGSAWVDLAGVTDARDLAARAAKAAGCPAADSDDPEVVADALLEILRSGLRLVVLDGYADVPESVVDALSGLVAHVAAGEGAKLLVLAQETTPAYCRFYGTKEIAAGLVVERHVKGLDLEGCRTMLGNPGIDAEDLRRIFLLTKGCPLYLQFIREGDEYGLAQNSRFTKAEIRLLLYSGRGSG